MQVKSKHALKVWKQADCDKGVRYLLTPLTAMAKQQFVIENVREVDKDGETVRVNFGEFADIAARYCVLDIQGLKDGKKEFKLVKYTIKEYGMKTCVRADSWERIPEILKSEIYNAVQSITDLPEKEIESLGFTVLLPGTDWTSAPVAKPKK